MVRSPRTLLDAVNTIRGLSGAQTLRILERTGEVDMLHVAARIRFDYPDVWDQLFARVKDQERRTLARFAR